MATELGKAYVQIVPSAEGIQGKIQNVLNKEAGAAGDSAGDSIGKKLVAGVTGIVAAAGIGKMISSAIGAGADMEQLEGGAKLMYGEAFDFIEERAKSAFQNVQMSQNDYLQHVNGFAVGLKTALGGNEQAAAELADQIITAEADIVAATGNSQVAVQNAFNGIMKGNFTMLDNLQLGITPTKEGFQEVIDKVNEWRIAQGESGDLVIDNLADCQQALVDYVEMQGVAGYAAEEGASTFSGSLAAMRGALTNLLGDISLGKDIGPALQGLSQTVGDFFFDNFLPMLGNLFSSLPDVLLGFMDTIDGYGDMIGATALDIVESLAVGLIENLPRLIEGFAEMLQGLIGGITSMDWGSVVDSIMTALNTAFPGGIPQLLQSAGQIVTSIVTYIMQNAPRLLQAGIQMLGQFAAGIGQSLPTILSSAAQVVSQLLSTIGQNLPQFLQQGIQLLGQLAAGLISGIPRLLAAIPQILSQVASAFQSTDWRSIGSNIVQGIANGVAGAAGALFNALKGLASSALNAAKNALGIESPSKVFRDEVGKYISLGIGEGIEDYMPTAQLQNSLGQMASQAMPSGGRSVAMGGITFNIYGAGMSTEELTDAIMDKITNALMGGEAAYA